ncbi:bile acid:sodium symporter family protein [Nostocoides sp. F2B08]|uniref:bile acid:sodium symporter family protein n=1 Tax=Nostocoides sp. F2B08 TaxID=2653936 RepID=UPI0012635CBB|nr:bile acid:sodium symporter [Tetrasphaera sp. F2B08]KAB7745701.1 bile acid:sodium symporter family protein [Tetrasphaera sp. F2B08]
MDEVLLAITRVAMLTFVVAGMAAMGLSLTVAGILRPLRNGVLVIGLLVVNFVVVPALTVLATRVLPMEEAAATAVILLGCCAGAPFLPALAKLANGDPNLAVGSMVLLMVVTVIYAPLVVPLVVPGAEVSAWDIASSLVVLMLIPLLLGLLARARHPAVAAAWAGTVGQVSTGALFLALGAGILVSWRDVLGSVGTWIFVGALIVLVVGLAAGYLAAVGRSRADRWLVGLASAQRNISAALVIAASLSGDVVVRTLVAALVVPVVLLVLAGEIGKRATR